MCTFDPSGYVSKFDFPKLLKSQKQGIWMLPKSSVMRVATMAVLALDAASPHRVDQVGEDPLWKRLPLSLQASGTDVWGIPGRGVVDPDFAILLIPEVLNRVEIGTACWPLHSVDRQTAAGSRVTTPCPVGANVVILGRQPSVLSAAV